MRQAYRERGYFKALTSEPTTHVRDAGGLNPFTLRPSKGKRIDILMPVEEGERYKLGGITFTGNTHVPNVKALRAQFAQKDGDWFNATLFSKGLDQLRKSYGALGYINMVANRFRSLPTKSRRRLLSTSTLMKASRSMFRGSSLREIRLRATK